MSPQRRTFCALAALASVLALAAPAQASKVLVVDGARAVWKNDPYTPAPRLAPPAPRAALAARASSTKAGRRAVSRALRASRRSRRIGGRRFSSYRSIYAKARRVGSRLGGSRGSQLGSVIATLESLARKGRLTSSRMPALFLQLRRNTEYWPSKPFLASGDRVSFRGSEMLFEYYPGQGLQIQPLGNFGKANGMISACLGIFDAPCEREGIRRLLGEMSAIATDRGGFLTWEYYFSFGGGNPPWISGMAQATGIQALARAADLLGEPRFTDTARKGLGAFKRHPPVGVRTRGPDGGVHYLQYSFSRGLYILNAFAQTVTGLYDYWKLTGEEAARKLWRAGDSELRREVPHHDIGDWSLYNRGGHESSYEYHDLLTDFLKNLCDRLKADVYCNTAKRFRGYMRDPAELAYRGPATATKGEDTRIRFNVSKLSAVEIKILRDGELVFNKVLTFRRGNGYFTFRPRSVGFFEVQLGCKELRTGKGLKTKASGEFEVVG
jgi:D-glucuronyl C5-epimerase C-terminus